jgi:hypothetical protein
MLGLESCVFHYTKLDTCVSYILPSMSLMANPLERVNDPREAKMWPFRFYSRTPQTFNSALFHAATRNLTEGSYVLSLSRNMPGLDPHDPLSHGFGHPRMWSQYGDKHRGVCLAFDTIALDAAVRQAAGSSPVFSGAVTYHHTTHGPSGNPDDPFGIRYLEDIESQGLEPILEAHIGRFGKHLFLTKHSDWQQEWEYRWVVRSSPGTPVYVPMSSALRAVIVGQECSSDGLAEILRGAANLHVPVYRIFWRGWAAHFSGNLLEGRESNARSLNGINFSQHVPCSSVFTQAFDDQGGVRTVEIRSSGEVIMLE